MNTKQRLFAAVAVGLLTSMTACARVPDAINASAAAAPRIAEAPPAPTATPAADAGSTPIPRAALLPRMVVHKSASCGCCKLWVEHMRTAGFDVEVRESDNVNPVKERVGVPLGKGSCHTAEVGGYFVEGHVPAGDVKRLLAQKPDAKGLVLPGMPAGSPGMEMPDGTTQAYTVELVGRDGSTTAFAQH
ncbi:MAG: DUF411 domain-containing protein [Pseudoxanthomonas sp.]